MKKYILIQLILVPFIFFAQEQPKVGLVLSGGGAKGFAHVGVLQELEKAGVQIDYIGGTSMGAIVGGLYASGYSANQIEEIITKANFNSLMRDEISRRDKPFFEKEYKEKHAISLPIKNNKVGLPLGLSKGQNVLNFLTELLASVDNVTDFSKLSIPFFCIATDIEKGEQVLLEKGYLPLALRASGSFPSLLNPVEIDGKLLIDGGVINNFPVDVMKKKGVDIIIGVNVQGELYDRKELSSAASILAQIINFQMYEKADKQIDLTNVYLRPDIAEYNVLSFDEKENIFKKGVKSAKPFHLVFDSIAKLQTKKKVKRKIITKPKKFKLDRVNINGNKDYTDNFILGKLQIEEGDSLSYHDISKKINTLSATDNFRRIDYHLSNSFEGKKLELKVKEEDIKSYLRLGVHYDLLYNSGVLLNYNHKKLLFKNDELSFDFIVGDRVRYNLEYFIDNGIILSYGLRSSYNSFKTNILFSQDDINKIDIRYRDFSNSVYAQTTLDKKFAIGFGLELKSLKISSETFSSDNEEVIFDDSNYINSFAFLKLDTFDKSQFPTNGFFANVDFKWFMHSNRDDNLAGDSASFNQFSQLDGSFSFATTFFDKLTLQYTSQAGVTFGDKNIEPFNFRLGSYNKNFINNFYPLYGYGIAELNNKSFLKSELEFRYCVAENHFISTIANFARVEENVFENIELFNNIKSGYAVGYGIKTLVGPIELKYSWSPDHSKKYWLFNLGFWF